MYVVAWRYIVRSGCKAAFARAYAPDGDWARLFARQAGYLRTELVRLGDGAWATLDYWESKSAFDAFFETFQREYDALDGACNALTEREELLFRGETTEG